MSCTQRIIFGEINCTSMTESLTGETMLRLRQVFWHFPRPKEKKKKIICDLMTPGQWCSILISQIAEELQSSNRHQYKLWWAWLPYFILSLIVFGNFNL